MVDNFTASCSFGCAVHVKTLPRKPRNHSEEIKIIKQPAKVNIPKEFKLTRESALKAIHPIQSAPANTYFYGERTRAGGSLPPYHLVYFLLVELLDFPWIGQSEKIAWSIPINFEGRNYVIEHRKMGLGVFASDSKVEEGQAVKIVALIEKGVKKATAFFEWLAEQAVVSSKLNVVNKSTSLFERFEYLRSLYRKALDEADERAGERIVDEKGSNGSSSWTLHFPALELRKNAEWLGLSAIDAFFSWTEHVFIHLAILQGSLTTGIEVANLAAADWQEKFKRAVDVSDNKTKKAFDDLIIIRRQLRNYMAHGAFGKRGEAFRFHSSAGAVPVLLPHQVGRRRFTLLAASGFNETSAFEVIEDFISHLWSNGREPAQLYLESPLPVILTHASNGIYKAAMQSMDDMHDLVTKMQYDFDRAADMDW